MMMVLGGPGEAQTTPQNWNAFLFGCHFQEGKSPHICIFHEFFALNAL